KRHDDGEQNAESFNDLHGLKDLTRRDNPPSNYIDLTVVFSSCCALYTMTRTILGLIATTLLCVEARAVPVDLGEISLTGTFTLNHNFNFNNPSAFPFGTFGSLTVQSATGIFGSDVSPGNVLT